MLRATPVSCGEGGSSGTVSIGAIHCDGAMKKNGTTSKGTTRWRCTTCKASLTRATQWSAVQAATFRMFIDWATSKNP